MFNLCRVTRVVVVSVAIGLSCDAHRCWGDEEAGKRPAAEAQFELPGDVVGLLAFVKDIHSYDPNVPEELVALERQRQRKLSYRQVEEALERLHQLATPGERQLPGFADAMGLRLVFRTIVFSDGARAGTPEERTKLIDEIAESLASSPRPPRDSIAAARKVVSALERIEPKQAIDVGGKYGQILSQSSDAKAVAAGARMAGVARRLTLVGKPLELSGTRLDGTPFDWSEYRGKVVLVDVWATWCGPCLRARPHVEKCYQRFHDQGFEVVAISVDEDRVALEKYLAEKPTPWVNLHDGGYWRNSFANHYGLAGLPTMILVDREGKVISIDAHPPRLEELLVECFATDGETASPGQ
jgi:thiol-disulfide isomerase/thioredoxin